MRVARGLGSIVALVLVGVSLSACAVQPNRLIAGSQATVVTDSEVGVINPGSARGEAAAMLGVDAALYAGFADLDAHGAWVADAGFGEVTVVGDSPRTVRYTVADPVRWSDGTQLDAVDLMLDWAAHSGRWPAFAAAGRATDTAEVPTVSADRKSLTLVEESASRDPLARFTAPMPAHVVAAEALGIARPELAKDAVLSAIDAALAGDAGDLNRLARFWNAGFAATASGEVLVSSGPYLVADAVPGLVELRPNPRYAGVHRPAIESVRIAHLAPRDGLQALSAGEASVLVATPDEALRELVPSLGIRLLTVSPSSPLLVAVQRQTVDGLEVAADGRRALWNVADWVPLG